MSVDYKLPEALTTVPRCLVALSGLDTKNNAVHRAVWDEFTTGGRRNDRKPILYKNFAANHLYPKSSETVSLLYYEHIHYLCAFQLMRTEDITVDVYMYINAIFPCSTQRMRTMFRWVC